MRAHCIFTILFQSVPATTLDEAPEGIATAGEVEVVSEDVKVNLVYKEYIHVTFKEYVNHSVQ